MAQVKRINGQNYADNVVDYLLSFNSAQTWTTVSGVGTATIDNTQAFLGLSSLKLENTTPTSDYLISNSVQSTSIQIGDDYDFSFYVRKADPTITYTGEVQIYKGASLYYTQAFSLGGDGSDDYLNKDYDEEWVRFTTDQVLEFAKSDVMTIRIQLDGISGYVGASTSLWIDGIMLSQRNRGNEMPPVYTTPVFNSTLSTSNVVLENLNVSSLPEYADEASASSLNQGDFYRTATGELRIKL